jgi:hypothetical protein
MSPFNLPVVGSCILVITVSRSSDGPIGIRTLATLILRLPSLQSSLKSLDRKCRTSKGKGSSVLAKGTPFPRPSGVFGLL